jgi:DNA end-binding protein Ku
MPARSVGSGTVSFGLVSIPVRFYVATHSENPSFNMLHQPCGSRIKQQIFCPKCERTVERSELVKGYEVSKDQYVMFTDEELRALETAASSSIDIQEFVPLATSIPCSSRTRTTSARRGRRQGVPPARRRHARARRSSRSPST